MIVRKIDKVTEMKGIMIKMKMNNDNYWALHMPAIPTICSGDLPAC
jgi:hypothetical protein